MSGKVAMSKLIVSLLLVAVLLSACGGGSTDATPSTADSDGAALLQDRCTQCHGLNKIENQKMTQEQWEKNVVSMVAKGAVLTTEEQQILIAYLAATYGN